MSSIFSNTYIMLPAVGILIFFAVYFSADHILKWLHKKSLGKREYIIEKLDSMFVKVDQKKLTMTMLLLSFGLGIICFFLIWPQVIPAIFVSATITIMGWSVPTFVVDTLHKKRCDQFVSQMVDGMTIMANGVRSGLSVSQAMDRVVANSPNPMSQEFRLVLSEVRIGRTLEEALNSLGERIPRPDVLMFVTSVNILKETGGNMAETFQTIMYTIRERQKIEKKIEALTMQGRTQGIIIGCVPPGMLVMFYFMDPKMVMPMFTTPIGWMALALVLALEVVGGLMIKKIVTINV